MVPPDSEHHRPELTRFLNGLASGNADATSRLMPHLYAELRSIAGSYMVRDRCKGTLQPTALVNEAFLRLFGPTNGGWKDRRHFFAVAARAMRSVLVDHARRRKRLKRGGRRLAVTLSEVDACAKAPELDLLDLDLAIEDLSAEDEQAARIVELRYFGGLEMAEVADVLGVSKSTVERGWRAARAWLGAKLSGDYG